MLIPQTRSAHLHRIDDARNMARFYSLTIQPTLFGGASLIRNWGRIGTKGQIKIETFDEPQDVDCAFIRLERVKRRRGYVDLGNASPVTSVTGAASDNSHSSGKNNVLQTPPAPA